MLTAGNSSPINGMAQLPSQRTFAGEGVNWTDSTARAHTAA